MTTLKQRDDTPIPIQKVCNVLFVRILTTSEMELRRVCRILSAPVQVRCAQIKRLACRTAKQRRIVTHRRRQPVETELKDPRPVQSQQDLLEDCWYFEPTVAYRTL